MSEFVTERLPLAIFLHAREELAFVTCRRASPNKVQFVFEDPDDVGAAAELDFDRGALVKGTAVFASQKFLRRAMTQALENRRNEERHERHAPIGSTY